jgi:cytochrome P450
LTGFCRAKEKHPETVGEKGVLGLGTSMVLAGSETTAITLTAILYYLVKNPGAYEKLQQEVDRAFGHIPPGEAVPFQEAQKLVYLDA